MVRAVRGAITVENNDAEEILTATGQMLEKIFEVNDFKKDDMISMLFSLTPDLNAVFPARAARNMGIVNVPLMCMSEIPIEGALKKCIRVLIHVNSDKTLDEINHVYLGGATVLRPDLVKE